MSGMCCAPDRIGRYELERELGRGAMGIVWRAYDPHIGRPVAIKLLRADLLSREDREAYLVRFNQEARAAGRCTHPNIVAVYDFAMHEGNPYLAMEYINGTGLDEALRQVGQFAPEDAVAVIVQVLDALDAAHSQGVVHRDVKPANILLHMNGHVKVTDFGVARLRHSLMTEDGAVIGTPAYMSPEQWRGERVDLRSDLFSVGAVLYELLSGRKIISERGPPDAGPDDIAQLVPQLPHGVVAALRCALAPDRESRFSSAGAMADALRASVKDGTGDTVVMRSIRAPLKRTLSPAALQQIEHALALRVGPIAKVLLPRVMARANSEAQLLHLLAGKIDRADDRDAFLREATASIRRAAS